MSHVDHNLRVLQRIVKCSVSKSVAKVDNLIWESSTVNICYGICDSCDLCAIESCELYDISPEATRRFIRALNFEQTARVPIR